MTRHDFSDTVMDHFLHPRNAGGELAGFSGEGWSGRPDSARFMRIQVRLDGGRVAEARFGTYGCAPAIAAGSYLTEWVRGRTLEEARAYTPKRLLRVLGGLPEHRRYCADLAVDSLHAAIADALSRQALAVEPTSVSTRDLEVVTSGHPGAASEATLEFRTEE